MLPKPPAVASPACACCRKVRDGYSIWRGWGWSVCREMIGAQASVFWIPTFIRRLSGLPGPKVALPLEKVVLRGLLGVGQLVGEAGKRDRKAFKKA